MGASVPLLWFVPTFTSDPLMSSQESLTARILADEKFPNVCSCIIDNLNDFFMLIDLESVVLTQIVFCVQFNLLAEFV